MTDFSISPGDTLAVDGVLMVPRDGLLVPRGQLVSAGHYRCSVHGQVDAVFKDDRLVCAACGEPTTTVQDLPELLDEHRNRVAVSAALASPETGMHHLTMADNGDGWTTIWNHPGAAVIWIGIEIDELYMLELEKPITIDERDRFQLRISAHHVASLIRRRNQTKP